MQGKGIFVIFAVLSIVLICGANSCAAISDANNVKEATEGLAVQCTACHLPGNFKELNSYGTDYKDAGRNVKAVTAIADKDSDGDGVSNADEISGETNPGDEASQ